MIKKVFLCVISGLLPMGLVSAEALNLNWQCKDNVLVELGSTKQAVINQCGKPLSSEKITVGKKHVVEELTYKQQSDNTLYMLTFQKDKLIKIRNTVER